MILKLLLTVQIIICVCLTAVILMQRSEGGALGMGGGGSGGFMTARGAGNLLTRTTAILAALFFAVSFGLTWVGNYERNSHSLTDQVVSAAPGTLPAAPATPAPTAADAATPATGDQPAAPATSSLDSLAAPLPGAQAPAEPAPAAKK